VPIHERTPLPRIRLETRRALHEWLLEHHGSHRGFWLESERPGPTIPYEELVGECLIFGWIDSTVQTFEEGTYGIRLTPRKPNSVWSASNKRRLASLTAAGLMQPAGVAAVEIAKANGMYTFLDDVEAQVVPEDLLAALGDDLGVFEQFPPGRRKQALYWIKSAKRPQTRADRIAKIAQAAREGRSVF
jgi:uncharacterized protein YdeI (YjbR/CyaY-like superfamily)